MHPASPFRNPRELLDEATALIVLMFERRQARGDGKPGTVAELDAAIGEQRRRIAGRRGAGEPMPMELLRRRCALSETEDLVLWLLALSELSPPVRHHVTRGGHAGIDIELIGELVYGDDTVRLVNELAPEASLVGCCLVEWVQPRRDGGYLDRTLRVAPRVLELALGRMVLDAAVASVATLVEAVSPDGIVAEAGALGDVLAFVRASRAAARTGRPAPMVAIVGRAGSGRGRLAAAGGSAIRVETAALPTAATARAAVLGSLAREALLFDAVLVFDDVDRAAAGAHEADVAERLRAIDLATGPNVAIVVTARGDLTGPQRRGRGLLSVRLPPLTEDDRRTLWQRSLDGAALADVEVAAVAAARYGIPAGSIVDAAAVARSRAAARGTAVTIDDLHQAVSARLGEELGTLAIRLTWRASWEDLVLPDDIADELRELRARVRHRRTVHDTWGFGAKLGKGLGLSALFSGPPGTGKSLAAAVIAQELGLELYQIDLARVVSKYVGETEQHLSRLFDAAEAGHAVLLFDEADALFARRTDVKSSIDRYANLEVNYLLQRMESFSGITILTTNAETVIDDAFRRRLAFRITFPLPEADERARLWRAHLPLQAGAAADVDVDALAHRYAMSGGYIKNAVLRAAFLAADDGLAIRMEHLTRAAGMEYAAMGKVLSQGR